ASRGPSGQPQGSNSNGTHQRGHGPGRRHTSRQASNTASAAASEAGGGNSSCQAARYASPCQQPSTKGAARDQAACAPGISAPARASGTINSENSGTAIRLASGAPSPQALNSQAEKAPKPKDSSHCTRHNEM